VRDGRSEIDGDFVAAIVDLQMQVVLRGYSTEKDFDLRKEK
jgi:hypothetical protein